jgi:hypothetical protein
MVAQSFSKNIALSLCSLFISVFIAELFCRIITNPPTSFEVSDALDLPAPAQQFQVTDQKLPYRMVYQTPHGLRLRANLRGIIKNHVLSQKDIELRTDSLGLRGHDPMHNHLPKILVLGDSITLADYADENETIPALLSEHFKNQFIFVNAGVATTGTQDQFYRYLEVRDSLKPKVVLVGMFLDDARSAHGVRIQKLPAWADISRLGALMIAAAPKVRRLLLLPEESPGEALRIADISAMWAAEGWTSIAKTLELLKQDARAHGITLGLFLFPLAEQVYAQGETTTPNTSPLPQEHFIKMCSDLELPCFDLLPALREAHKKEPHQRLFFDFCHLTVSGHHIVAKALAQWLIQEDISKR